VVMELFAGLAVYHAMIDQPEQSEMAVDIACRTALSERGVSHLTIPINVQESRLLGKYSGHKVADHTSDRYSSEVIPSSELLEQAANVLNSGERVVILVGQGALRS